MRRPAADSGAIASSTAPDCAASRHAEPRPAPAARCARVRRGRASVVHRPPCGRRMLPARLPGPGLSMACLHAPTRRLQRARDARLLVHCAQGVRPSGPDDLCRALRLSDAARSRRPCAVKTAPVCHRLHLSRPDAPSDSPARAGRHCRVRGAILTLLRSRSAQGAHPPGRPGCGDAACLRISARLPGPCGGQAARACPGTEALRRAGPSCPPPLCGMARARPVCLQVRVCRRGRQPRARVPRPVEHPPPCPPLACACAGPAPCPSAPHPPRGVPARARRAGPGVPRPWRRARAGRAPRADALPRPRRGRVRPAGTARS